jgi:serine protease Do
MRLPRLPDWLIYGAVVLALLLLALGHRDRNDAPSTPAATRESEGAVLAASTPFDPSVTVDVPDAQGPSEGTAFSVASSGVWMTARHVVDGCKTAAIVVGKDRGVAARVDIDPRGEAALMTTQGGGPALPLGVSGVLHKGQRAFHPGFPQGKPGEATTRLIGRETLVVRGRGARSEPVLVWAETGRTEGMDGSLGGLSGAPAMDAAGRVVGVTIAESPRRGRLYTTAPETVSELLQLEHRRLPPAAVSGPVTPQNYGQVADGLRRDLRVAQVVCLT